jgi:hypothetical protein
MKFVRVAKTQVLFSIWDTRVGDFLAFIENKPDYDVPGEMWSLDKNGWNQRGATWKNPGFKQGATDPVVGVSWHDANAFCEWLTKQEHGSGVLPAGIQYRLPTDEEWSIAVGLDSEPGSTPEEKNCKKNAYPWGKKWPPPPGAGNYRGVESRIGNEPKDWPMIEDYNDGYPRTSPAESFAANQFGLYDMGGNVWQWCEDWYNSEKKGRVIRGASWYECDPRYLLASCRFKYMPTERGASIGFRCVLVRPEQSTTEAPNLQTGIQQLMPIDSKARQPLEPLNLGVADGKGQRVGRGSDPAGPGGRRLAIPILAILIVVLVVGFVYPLVFHPKLQVIADAILLNSFQPTKPLKIENIGNATLQVKITPGRDAVLINPSTLNIKPGESALAELSLDAAATNVTEIDTFLDLQTNDPKFPHFPVTVSWRNVKRSVEEAFDQVHHDLYRKTGAPD